MASFFSSSSSSSSSLYDHTRYQLARNQLIEQWKAEDRAEAEAQKQLQEYNAWYNCLGRFFVAKCSTARTMIWCNDEREALLQWALKFPPRRRNKTLLWESLSSSSLR